MQVALTGVALAITLSVDADPRFNFHWKTTMSYNPFEAPVSNARVVGVISGTREELVKTL